jgi:hypothetical protein
LCRIKVRGHTNMYCVLKVARFVRTMVLDRT